LPEFDDDLPVAEVVQPLPPKVTEPAPAVKSLPKAMPVRESAPKPPPIVPKSPIFDAANQTEPPKPQWIAACGVIGCLGVVVIAAIALLAWIAITLLSQIGEKISERRKDGGTAEIKASIQRGPIAATTLPDNHTLHLSSQADAIGRGAGGRLLLLRIPRLRQLDVFDANRGEIALKIPVDEEKALFAAGANKVYVYKQLSGRIEKIDLWTGHAELEKPLPQGIGLVDGLAIGAGSDGPLYLFTVSPNKPSRIHVLDTATMELTATHEMQKWIGREDRQVNAHASFDGRLLGVAGANGAVAIPFNNNGNPKAIPLTSRTGAAPVLATPSPDGQYLYTTRGVFDAAGKQLSGTSSSLFSIPTAHGSGLFVGLNVENGILNGHPQLYAAGGEPPEELITLKDGELAGELRANVFDSRSIPAIDRIHLWPGAGLLAVLPVSNQELQLFKVDVRRELQRSSREFIAFASDPPTIIQRGAEWRYMPQFWSLDDRKKPSQQVSPSITFEGPRGMHREKEGWLIWNVPPDVKEPIEVTITATLDNAENSSATQKFRLRFAE
jgi:hypothetical protein